MISKPSTTQSNPLRVGIGGPVGSGKTALTLALCQALRDEFEMAVVTNDIYTAEDAKFLVAHAALDPAVVAAARAGEVVLVGRVSGTIAVRSLL